MQKILDWGAIAQVNFDDNRRKKLGIPTFREAISKAHENLAKSQAALARRKEVEPLLRQALMEHMVDRKPIRVLQPIRNPTESLGGLKKSEDDDGFYSTSPSMSAEGKANLRFEEVMETIPAGTELVFKALDRQLGQWIFKGSDGEEYAVYDKPQILFQKNAIENPGFFGLLFNTHLVDLIGEPEG